MTQLHSFFICSLNNVRPDNYIGTNGQPEGFLFCLLDCKFARNTTITVHLLFLTQPCFADGHSYFENDEDDSEEMAKISV